MNPPITTLDPVTHPLNTKTVLNEEGFVCSILNLAPGDETPLRESQQVDEHLLFVLEGDATVRFGELNTILSKDDALLIPKGKQHVIAAHPGGWAKILRVDVPPRQIVTPQILSFDR